MRLDRAADAVESYRRAIEIDPKFAEAQNNLGKLLLLLGEMDEAVSAMVRAKRIDPDLAQSDKPITWNVAH